MGLLSPELSAWITPGLAGALCVVDAAGWPQIARIWAARAHGDDIEVFVQRASALRVLDALSERRRGAVNLIAVTSYCSRLFRGSCALTTETSADRAFVEASVVALGRAFHSVGMSADSAERMLGHAAEPDVFASVVLTVEAIFDQSPKPGAGAAL